MKLTNQLVALIGVIVVGIVGMVVSLAVFADWSDGAVIGMVSAFGTLATGVIVAIRNQQQTRDDLDALQQQVGAGQRAQVETLETVVRQTNGLSEAERQDIAHRAATEAIEAMRTRYSI